MARHVLLTEKEMLDIAPDMVSRAIANAKKVKDAAPMWSLNLSSGSGVVKGKITNARVAGFRETRCYREMLYEVTMACSTSDCKVPGKPLTLSRSFKVLRLPNV